MILIFSQEHDTSSNQVIEWLEYYNQKVIRINSYKDYFSLIDPVKNISITNSIDNEDEKTSIKSIWYRRRGVLGVYDYSTKMEKQAREHLSEELKILFQYQFVKLNKQVKLKLGTENGSRINKLVALEEAKAAGLLIPNTYITTNKSVLKNLISVESNLITKPIAEATFFIDKKNKRHGLYTEKVTQKIVKESPDIFFPSLLQNEIEKDFEIRTYFLCGVCYSMAIFSQQSDQTATDFRVYDTKNRNRNVPYQLPRDIENKIKRFMKKMNLNEGSIDLIKTNDNKFVFLEVNPAGQFGMVSRPCNYYLEKKIAQYLANEKSEK